MKKKIPFLATILLGIQLLQAQFVYPKTPEIPVVDDYNGMKITDNYRWLEDMKNPEVQSWFKEQANFSQTIINKIPGRDALYQEMMKLDQLKDAVFGNIITNNGNYYYQKTLKNEKVAKLYSRPIKGGAEVLIFDPMKYKAGKVYSISSFGLDDAGKYLAIGLAENGAEIGEGRVMEVATQKLLPEIIAPIWGFDNTWTKDGKSLFYTKLQNTDNTSDDMLKDMRCMLHKIGTDTKNDVEVASRQKNPELPIKPENWVSVFFSDDYKYIFLNVGSVKNELLCYYAPAAEFGKEKINWKPFINYDDEVTDFKIIGDKIYYLTHKNAPNFKIGVTDFKNPDFKNSKIIVPESNQFIRRILSSKNYLFYTLSDGINKDAYQFNPKDNAARKIPLNSGNNGISPLNSKENDDVICYNTGWLIPLTLYNYSASNGKLQKSVQFNSNAKYPGIENFAVKEVEVKSHDGVMVPLSIIYPKNLKMDGSTVCYLDGYGSYGISISPNFWEPFFALMKQNVIYAIAHARGGGEKGENWHLGAYKTTKQNTWKDFIACGDYLVNNGYTSPQKLIGTGMSAGGILIGNAVAERPDLFAVAIDEVGCTNMLRMETTPNGPNQIPEFGALSNPEELKGLIEMDAQHKIKKGTKYPAILVRTGYNDPRVIPWMPAKFAAVMQNSSESGKPNLFLVNFDNGHFTEDKTVTYKDFADMFAFALWQTGHKNFQPK